ncbi:methyl-accepting chemotaxis protein [Methylobacterium frigidaeris]|uniref:Methyl-accepting chemotaxis protein n=1 Tax=Methylobacterium frigidaeris TaxID=2038277 RepID=A0AA37M959_9HYPH|nr:HAMP domain-containing methyl-accepting chemotaxis protein [Methylobacterium frigidaeris]GJD66836.1 hypothetical protein MPEAHAMD_7035 [Methylobacterium frigidaeris]
MKPLNNLSFLAKMAIPLSFTVIISVGLVSFAREELGNLAEQTQHIIDVEVDRLADIMNIQLSLSEAVIQNRNLLLEKRRERLSTHKERQDAAIKASYEALNKLSALAENAERRAANDGLRKAMDTYYGILARTAEHGFRSEIAEAVAIAQEEAVPVRAKLRDQIKNRIDILTAELAAAKKAAALNAEWATMMLVVSASLGFLASILLAGGIVVFVITRPLARLVSVLQRMAQGEVDAEIAGVDRGDEVGSVARAVQSIKVMVAKKAAEEAEQKQIADQAAATERRRTMVELAHRFEAAVGGIIGMVSSSSTELQATAQTMTATATETASQSTTVAAAAEQAASNVNTVAAAAEELGSSVQEIGRQVNGSAQLAQAAVIEAAQTASLVQDLSGAVTKIGDVVTMISTIAGQTNLLALNATIEAARAGEAGRGFAVVAAEVKELASQTARATEDISGQITRIQGSTGQAVSAISSITARIQEISGVATAIAAAVEEQGAATQEIVRNVAQAAMGTEEVTSNIAGVAGAAEETGAAASQVLGAASEVSRQSEHLSAEVSRFLSNVRAA